MTVFHLVKDGSKITACGRNMDQQVIDAVIYACNVTCQLCRNTVQFKRTEESDRERGVGIPTVAPDPLVHMASSGTDPAPYCIGMLNHKPDGFSTMDLSAVTCQFCINSVEFHQRNDHYVNMMSPTLEPDEPESARYVDEGLVSDEDQAFLAEAREAGWDLDKGGPTLPVQPVKGRDHDRHGDGGSPRWTHDCEACTFLGSFAKVDLYFCRQSNDMPTVIVRSGDEGEAYTSGLFSARDNSYLALAVVRAIHRGLLAEQDLRHI